MHQFDLINAYFHLLHRSERVFLYRILADYEHVQTMCQWLEENNIDLPFVSHINEENYPMCKKVRQLSKLEALIGYPCVKEVEEWCQKQEDKYQVLFLHCVSNNHPMNDCLTNKQWLQQYHSKDINVFSSTKIYSGKELSFNAPCSSFFEALYKIDDWPGVLVTKGKETFFQPVQTKEDIDLVFEMIRNDRIFLQQKEKEADMYIMHLSDLHLGLKSKQKGMNVLCDSIDTFSKRIYTEVPLQFVITGDLMNSPNQKASNLVSYFIRWLKRKHHGKVTYVLGNHDVLLGGLNIMSSPRTRIIASLLEDGLDVVENQKVIYIKINSALGGNLARGKIGHKQLIKIEEELEMIENVEDYTLIALVHHHVFPIEKDVFLKKKWHEKIFIHRIIESTKVLKDSDEFVEWLKSRNVSYVMHGHKHLPYFHHQDGLYVMAAGSSCGGGAKELKSRYLSYNVVKFDPIEKQMKYCFICYDDMTKSERQRVKVHLF